MLSVLILGERMRFRRWTATILGFVGTLVILDQRDDRATGCHRGSVERVHELRAFLARRFVTDVEPAGLVIGAVAGASYLAKLPILAAAGHPRFQVELAIGGPA